jgi:glyoxylase-like metal-dependent hydrolase (beta-lactamase superfamily II)
MRALELGAVRAFWLDGGGFRLDGGSLFGPVPRPRWSALYPPAEDNSVPLTAHVVLVNAGGQWGLIDSGFGHHLTERQRRFYTLDRESHLAQGLAELGLAPAAIDWVVLSHLHLDHAGGVLTRDAVDRVAPAFPNAPVWVQRIEADEAHDATNRAHSVYAGPAFDQLDARGLIRIADGTAEVAPHVRVVLTGGHSRGHQGTLIDADPGGGALLHLGDLLVTSAHLPPAWVSALDDFPLDSIRSKREWLGQAAQGAWWVVFSHDVRTSAARLGSDGTVSETWHAGD